MQVKVVNIYFPTRQDSFSDAQPAPLYLVVGASATMAHPSLIGFSFKKTRPIQRDVFRGMHSNEHDSYKFRRHRYRRSPHR
jgi:hypothetical protein